jgi:hypothetical protein
MSRKLCARYTLGARYLYFKMNAEKFGVRVIGRKIRYSNNFMTCNISFDGRHGWNNHNRLKRTAQEDNIKDFKAYPPWVFRFMKRNNLSVRFSTSVGQKLPDEAVSGDSDYVRDDTFSEMEGMEEIPKEILNAIDSFNVESDEVFLGFEQCYV